MGSTQFSGDDENPVILQTKEPLFFLLNGPPRSGKDTAAVWLEKRYDGKLLKFAEPIKRAVTAIYHGGDRAEFDKYDTAELKDTPQEVYFGKTCRQVQIGVSEAFLKPFHGDQRIFGNILARQVERIHGRLASGPYFISDSGFRPEAEVLVDKYGAKNIILFRIFRDGFTFGQVTDSRNYITLRDLGVREFDIQNPNDNMQAFYGALDNILEHCIPRT